MGECYLPVTMNPLLQQSPQQEPSQFTLGEYDFPAAHVQQSCLTMSTASDTLCK